MAIEFNDNIHVKINRPTDFRFGPFVDINQANATIPIAQRYHGLIFGVYTDPVNIATSDIIYYYYWDGLSDTDIKQLGGKPPVDGSYANQAAMIAAQAAQTAQYIYYDGTSYWEYLGTTNGNITDYRILSSGGSKWTDIGSDIYRNSKVLIGATTFVDTLAKLEIRGRVSQVGVGTGTYFGFRAGLNDTSEFGNTAFGYQAAYSCRTGLYWTAIGYNAGFYNQGSSSWTAVGTGAGLNNLEGNGWTAVGQGAGISNLTGSDWTAVGCFAAGYGSNWTAVGRSAGGGAGSDWTAVGRSAGGGEGSDWIAIGYQSARFYSAGGSTQPNFSNGVYIGHQTRVGATNAVNEIVIGYQAEGIGNDTIVIGNTSITNNYIRGNFNITDGRNLILGTTTGTKIGTSTTQKIGLWNATPIVQPTTAIAEAVFVENAGGAVVNVDSTFDGYTLQQAIKALRDMGAFA